MPEDFKPEFDIDEDVDYGHHLTFDELAAIIAKMSPRQRKMEVLTHDENTGDFVSFCRVEQAEACCEPTDKPDGQIVLLMASA